MKKYTLVKLHTNSKNVVPNKNINSVVNQDSPEKAALYFMHSAFAKKANKIQADVQIKNSQGKVITYLIQREKSMENKTPIYLHYVIKTLKQ